MAKPSFGKKETPLDYGALVKNLRDKGPEKLYLLWGEEDYLLADFVSRLRAACGVPLSSRSRRVWSRTDGSHLSSSSNPRARP